MRTSRYDSTPSIDIAALCTHSSLPAYMKYYANTTLSSLHTHEYKHKRIHSGGRIPIRVSWTLTAPSKHNTPHCNACLVFACSLTTPQFLTHATRFYVLLHMHHRSLIHSNCLYVNTHACMCAFIRTYRLAKQSKT